MNDRIITPESIDAYSAYLTSVERSENTIMKYRRDVKSFLRWLGENPVSQVRAIEWKHQLQEKGYTPASVNSMLIALNRYFVFMGWDECRVKVLKVQKRLFREESRNLTKEEYSRLVETALGMGKERLAMVMETICTTGIRVSEVRFITVEAARQEKVEIFLKGKIRTILLPRKLCRKLLKYAKQKKIISGEIFLTRNGTSLSRRQIWAEMKAICKAAGIAASKVFPHNLRHLFAQTFYRVTHDVAKLADLLGHSSIETTRIYLISTGMEHAMLINKLNLII